MKKTLLIVAGICGAVFHSSAQKDINPLNANGTVAGSEKVSKVHFKVNYHPYHNAHYPVAFIKPISRRNYRITIPKDNNRGLAGAKVLMHKRDNLPPISLLGYPSLAYGEPKPFDFCSCRTSGVPLYQCSAGRINKITLQSAPAAVSMKLSELADGNDGGLNIGLTQKTSLTVDLGYSKGATDSTQDLSMNMDSDGDDGLDISIGLQFGIR